MTRHWMRSWWLLALLLPTLAVVAPTPFVAHYELRDGDRRIGSSTVTLGPVDGRWRFSTRSAGERGAAGLLGARLEEHSDFEWLPDGSLKALRYDYRQRLAFRNRRRSIQFDWAKGRAIENDGNGPRAYAAPPGTLDRHLVVLALAEDLRRERLATHPVAYKGEVDVWRFESKTGEQVETGLGVLEATRLTRIRDKKARQTISWHAKELDYLPVRIVHVEPNGDRYEMRLTALERTR